MEPRVDVVVNRLASRLTRERPVLAALRDAVGSASHRASLHETRSLGELELVIGTLKARGTEHVILAGGDGSYLAGVTALTRAFANDLPGVGFAPGGTVCTVARNWGFRGDAATYAGGLVRSVLSGTSLHTPRPTLRVKDDQGGDRIGFIFGAGLVARFFDAYYEAPSQGYATAAALVARIFAGTFTKGNLATRILTPSPATLTVDGRAATPKAWSLIAASVVRDLGLHMRLLYRAGERTDAFHVVASPLSPRSLSPQVARVVQGRGLRGEGHVDTLARELVLEMPAGSTYVLDGDRIAATRVTLTAGPVLDYLSRR